MSLEFPQFFQISFGFLVLKPRADTLNTRTVRKDATQKKPINLALSSPSSAPIQWRRLEAADVLFAVFDEIDRILD
jgi:hypothetical protein